MDNQTRNHLNLQKHIADQDHIIRVRNAEIAALRKRAEEAERERDEALAGVRVLARENIECYERAAASCGHPNHGSRDHDCGPFMPAAESRPLAPDAITADAYERGVPVLRAAPQKPSVMVAHETVRAIVAAVLTEPPARPEGAEELARLIADADVGEWDCGDLADALLTTGRVRIIAEEDPR